MCYKRKEICILSRGFLTDDNCYQSLISICFVNICGALIEKRTLIKTLALKGGALWRGALYGEGHSMERGTLWRGALYGEEYSLERLQYVSVGFLSADFFLNTSLSLSL